MENTPHITAANLALINIDPDRNDETRNVKNFKHGDFPALKPYYDRQPHAHHK